MRLTEAQKQLIVLYRKQNMGYGEIAKKKYGSRYRIKDQVFSLFGEDAKRVWAE